MKFSIIVRVSGADYRLKVERIYASSQIEKYKVTGGTRSIVLQTNGPLFKTKGLKHRKGQWKVIEGKNLAWNERAVREICETIEEWIGKYGG